MTNQRRGRDLFRKVDFIIRFTTTLLRWLPKKIRKILLNYIEGWKGYIGLGIRYCIVKTLCKSCGNNVLIGPYIEFRYLENLSIGDNVSIHRNCYIDALGEITIGNDVSIAHGTSIISFDHTWGNEEIPIKDNPCISKPVVICDDVWIGCGCRILSGVIIESRVIVAAGAVVTKKIASGLIVGGVPAKAIKRLDEGDSN